MNVFRRVWRYRREPVVADHRIDLMALAAWAIIGLWGILSTVQSVTILKGAIDWYPIVWGSAIGLTSWLSFMGAFMLFFTRPKDYSARIAWKKLELGGVSALAVLVGVYPLLMFIDLFTGSPRPDLTVLSLLYLVIPIWRIGHLRSRILGVELLRAKENG